MATDFTQVNQFTAPITPPESTLGVNRQFQRFATSQYLNSRDPRDLVGTNDHVPDPDQDLPEDQLLLTNAVTENTVQDNLDKTRYLKEVKSYVTINSAARNQLQLPPSPTPPPFNPELGCSPSSYQMSLFSSGEQYDSMMSFAPYKAKYRSDEDVYIEITCHNNHYRFRLQDINDPEHPIQIIAPNASDFFDVYLPIGRHTIDQLQLIFEQMTNSTVKKGSMIKGKQHVDHRVDHRVDHLFTFDVKNNPQINPDRVIVQINSDCHYRFSWEFLTENNHPRSQSDQSIPASDAAFTVQNPSDIFPNPNSYALDLDKAYTTVKSIRIISSEIPNTDTIINSNNNHITFRLIDRTRPPPTIENPDSQNIKTSNGSIDWNIYLPLGNYKLIQLVTQMTASVNQPLLEQSGLKDIFKIVGDVVTGVFSITTQSPHFFTWNFNANGSLFWRNLNQMLGYRDSFVSKYVDSFTNLINVSLPNSHIIQKPYGAFQLRTSNVVWIQLNNYEVIYDTFTQNKYFCKFNLDNVKSDQIAYDTFTPSVQVFVDSPLPVLSVVDVRLYDEVGMPYNFNGVDHSFTLEITTHVDRMMGNDYSSRRGINDKSSYV